MTISDHPSQNIKIIYLPAMLQWPKDSCYVANTLSLQYKRNFAQRTPFLISLLLTRKEKLPKCQEIPIISAGEKNTSVLSLGGWGQLDSQTRLTAAVDYLHRKWCCRSFFHSKIADFALPVTLSSATFTDSYSVTPRLCLLVPKPNQQTKVFTERC